MVICGPGFDEISELGPFCRINTNLFADCKDRVCKVWNGYVYDQLLEKRGL